MAETEKIEMLEKKLEEIAEKSVDFYDIFVQAIKMAKEYQNPEIEPWISGMSVLAKKYEKYLAKIGVVEIEATKGDILNPHLHHVVETEENLDLPDESILSVINKGFTFNDKLIRPVRVLVNHIEETHKESNEVLNED